jgi:hypothetical protein
MDCSRESAGALLHSAFMAMRSSGREGFRRAAGKSARRSPHGVNGAVQSLGRAKSAYARAYTATTFRLPHFVFASDFIGAGEKSRTPDLRITNAGELVFALMHRR